MMMRAASSTQKLTSSEYMSHFGPTLAIISGGGSSPTTAMSASRSKSFFSFTLEVNRAVLIPKRLARWNRVSRSKNSADSIYVPSPVAGLYQKLPVMPCSHGKLAVMTEALLTLVTEGRTQLPVTQKPLAPIRRKFGTSAWAKYRGSPPSISMIKILRGIVSGSPELFDVITTAQDGAGWISRTARLQRDQVAKMLQEWRKFGKADSTLADLEMFVLVAVVVMQMNMLEAWPKGLNAGLNATTNVGVSS